MNGRSVEAEKFGVTHHLHRKSFMPWDQLAVRPNYILRRLSPMSSNEMH